MHLLDIEGLNLEQINCLLGQAQMYLNTGRHLANQLQTLAKKTLINLFFENSTRTRVSFELAAMRLGCKVVNIDITKSSINKGESLLDTIDTLRVMGADFFVIRHHEDGAVQSAAEHVGQALSVINAGDGQHAHPSQALLDMLTIRQYKQDFSQLKIAIIGDIAHSRVARSDITALKKLNAGEIRVIAPANLLPEPETLSGVNYFTHLKEGLADVDVIITLRIQKERMLSEDIPDEKQFNQQFGLSREALHYAKKDAIVMHPGPINRGVEINADVADGPQSVILKQVENGVAMRMAILTELSNYSRTTKN